MISTLDNVQAIDAPPQALCNGLNKISEGATATACHQLLCSLIRWEGIVQQIHVDPQLRHDIRILTEFNFYAIYRLHMLRCQRGASSSHERDEHRVLAVTPLTALVNDARNEHREKGAQ
jgi:hypothetical protein